MSKRINLLNTWQSENEILEAKLKTITAERDYSDLCGAEFEQKIRTLEKQLVAVRLLPEKWLSKDRYDHYDTSRESKTMTKCANELQAAIGENKSG